MQTRILATQSKNLNWNYHPQYKRFWMWWNFKGKKGGDVILCSRRRAKRWLRHKAATMNGNIHTVFGG